MDRRLTTREREIVHLIYLARGSKEIAARLFISVRTVRNHLQNIYRKLGITNQIDLAIWAMAEIDRAERDGRRRGTVASWRRTVRSEVTYRQEKAKIATKAY